MSPKSIALLVCDTPMPNVIAEHGDYQKIFSALLKDSLPGPDHDFTLDSYDVVHKMEYPDEDKLDNYDCIMLTGSGEYLFLQVLVNGLITGSLAAPL